MCHLELACLQIGRCPPDFGDLGQGTSLKEERQAEPVTYNPHPCHWEVLPLKLKVFLAAVCLGLIFTGK